MHQSPSTCVAYDSQGRLYSGGYDGHVIAWAEDWRQPRWIASHDQLVNSIDIIENHLYTASADRSVRVWDLEGGAELSCITTDHKDDLNVVRVSPDERYVAMGGEEGKLWLYDRDGRLLWSRASGVEGAPADCIDAVSFVVCGGELAVAAGDDHGTIALYDLAGNRLLRTSVPETIDCCGTDSQGRWLLFGLAEGSLAVLDCENPGEPLIVKPHTSAIKAVAVSRDGKQVVTTAYDGELAVHSLPDLKEVMRRPIAAYGASGWSRGLAFDPSRPGHVAATSLGTAPQIWNLEEGRLALPESPKTFGINALAAAESEVYCAGDDGSVRLLRNGRVEELFAAGQMVNALSISADGTKLAVGCQDGATLVIESASGRVLSRIVSEGSPTVTCAWSPDGRYMAVGSYNGISRVVEADTGVVRARYEGPDTVKSISFLGSPQRAVIGGADGHLLLWDTERDSILTHREGLYLINAVSWSDASGKLVTTGRDCVTRIWDEELNLLSQAKMHDRSIKGICWSPGGTAYATASYDTTVGIHADGKPSVYARGHLKPGVPSVDWIDEDTIVSGGWDGTLRTWDREGHPLSTHVIGAPRA